MNLAIDGMTKQVAWPPERFYWALLDASELPERRLTRGAKRFRELTFLFETVVPVPLEQLQISMTVVNDASAQFIVCGIEREILRTQLFGGEISLRPTSLPPFLAHLDGQADLSKLNMLHGDYLPGPVVQLRRRRRRESLAAVMVLAALLTWGMERRTSAVHRQADELTAAREPIYQQVLGPAMHQSAQPLSLQLTAELRRLQQTRSAKVPEIDSIDLTGELARLLALWPPADQVNALTQSISISHGSIAIRSGLPDTEQSQRLVEAIGSLARSSDSADAELRKRAWSLQQPAVRAARQGVDLEVRFTAVKQEAPP